MRECPEDKNQKGNYGLWDAKMCSTPSSQKGCSHCGLKDFSSWHSTHCDNIVNAIQWCIDHTCELRSYIPLTQLTQMFVRFLSEELAGTVGSDTWDFSIPPMTSH